jgi:hypothetical protein
MILRRVTEQIDLSLRARVRGRGNPGAACSEQAALDRVVGAYTPPRDDDGRDTPHEPSRRDCARYCPHERICIFAPPKLEANP